MAGEQHITGPELVTSMLALPLVGPTPPIEDEVLASAAYENLARNNPNLVAVVEQQQTATYAAIGRLMAEFQKQEPNTAENKEARNRAIFDLAARMSVVSALNAVGQAIGTQHTLEDMFNAPAQEPMSGGSGDVVS